MAKGPLLLAGSGEFTDDMSDVDRRFMQSISKPVVAVIPTAAGRESDWWKWAVQAEKYYTKNNISSVGVKIRTHKDANDPAIVNSLTKANVFYFSGGDPRYVLSVMEGSKAWDYIYSRFLGGAALAGSSAGAMFMGSFIPSDIRGMVESGKQIEWTKALGLVPYIIWPHYDWALKSFGDKITRLMENGATQSKSLGIDEDTAVLWKEGKNPAVLGRGQAHWEK